MQVVILAGGKGTRLKPYTTVIPKPLVPIDDIPILEVIIRQLKHYNVSEIIVSTGHLAELIEAYFRNGKKWGVKIRYVTEDKPLSTAGAIKKINGLDNNFIVMNGDILTDMNYKDIFSFHIKHKGAMTIGAAKREILTDFGVLRINKESRLLTYSEKPKRFDYVSMGINVLNKKCREYISKDEAIGIPELILRMQSKCENIYCFKSDSFWLDIGRMEDFQKAQEKFVANRSRFIYE